jgi:hypothetical protein
VIAEIVELVAGVELLARALGQEDLPTAAGLADARCSMDVEAEVRLVPDVRLAGVHSHPHAQIDARGPRVPHESQLGGDEGVGRGLEHRKGDEELVTALVDHDAVPALDRLPEEAAVVVEHVRVAVAEPLQELGRPLDVGENESDCSIGKIRHRSLLQGISARTRVPEPGGLSTSSRPLRDATRSASPRRPEPSHGSAPPIPSSVTSTTAVPVSPLDSHFHR